MRSLCRNSPRLTGVRCELLVSELERERYALLREENEADRFLDHLAARVESLPLYLKLLVDDLRRGRFQVDRPHELPADLTAYYDQLIERIRLTRRVTYCKSMSRCWLWRTLRCRPAC